MLQNKAAKMLVNKQIAYCDAEISLIHSKIMAIINEVLQEQPVKNRIDYLPNRIVSICGLLSRVNY